MEILCQKEANKDLQDNGGRTALIWAAKQGRNDVVTTLCQEGANKDLQDNDGRTALILAADRGHNDVVTTLCQQGANKDLQDNDGCTALMLAAFLRRNDVVATLCQQGANKDVKDNTGYTALWAAYNIRGDLGAVEIISTSYPYYEASKLPVTLAFAFWLLIRLLDLYYSLSSWINVVRFLFNLFLFEAQFLYNFCKGGYPVLYSCLRTNIERINVLNYSTLQGPLVFIFMIFNVLYYLSTNEMLASDLKRIREFWLVDETATAIYASCDVGSSSTDGASCKPL